jgi:hypothetical protein
MASFRSGSTNSTNWLYSGPDCSAYTRVARPLGCLGHDVSEILEIIEKSLTVLGPSLAARHGNDHGDFNVAVLLTSILNAVQEQVVFLVVGHHVAYEHRVHLDRPTLQRCGRHGGEEFGPGKLSQPAMIPGLSRHHFEEGYGPLAHPLGDGHAAPLLDGHRAS